jgi:peptidoglycan/xylan/chitin deacetylase (PgdA/CDA1 family)
VGDAVTRFTTATLICASALAAVLLELDGPARVPLAALAVVAWLAAVGLGVAFIRLELFGPAFCHGRPGRMRVALTFDDGPDPVATPRLLELLQQRGVPATFFCIGARAREFPDLVRRMISGGHLVGNHSYRHAWWTNFLIGRWLEAELEQAQRVLGELIGHPPAFFRSPMGLTNPHLAGALRRHGLTLIGWDVRSFDQKARSAGVVIDRILGKVHDGSIILLHDGGGSADVLLEVVGAVIDALRDRGYDFVRVDGLLADSRGGGRGAGGA